MATSQNERNCITRLKYVVAKEADLGGQFHLTACNSNASIQHRVFTPRGKLYEENEFNLNFPQSHRSKSASAMNSNRRMNAQRSINFNSAGQKKPPCTGLKSKIRYAYTLNLGGEKFKIKTSMLANVEGSLFSELNPSHPSYDKEADEYFFDRSSALFTHIYDHLDGMEVHFPHCVCPRTVCLELRFWKLSPDILSPCCSRLLTGHLDQKDTLKLLEKAIIKEKIPPEEYAKMTSAQKWRARIYDFLDDPDSSRYARVWVVLYTILVLTSITFACIVTLPEVRVPTNATACLQYINSSSLVYSTCATTTPDFIWWTSIILNVLFLIEMLTKFITFPGRKMNFFLSVLNIMDVIAVFLTLATNIMLRTDPEYWQHHIASLSSLNAIASLLRVGRMMQFFKHNKALRVLVLTLRFSKGDLMVLLFLFLIAMLLYGVAMYVAEYDEPEQFKSIPEGMWWALVTMTTVGYNDFRPITLGGYILGGACALIGVVITGSAIPLSASSFERLSSLSTLVGTRKN